MRRLAKVSRGTSHLSLYPLSAIFYTYGLDISLYTYRYVSLWCKLCDVEYSSCSESSSIGYIEGVK